VRRLRDIGPACGLVLGLVLVGCGSDRVAGGSSTETSNTLAARFVDDDGAFADSALVRIRPALWNRAEDLDSLVGSRRTRLDTVLDSSGILNAGGFLPGTYTVEVVSPMRALRRDLRTGERPVVDTLREPGGLAGQILPRWKGTIRILGTDRVIATDSAGAFGQGWIPSGPVTLDLRGDSAGVVRRLRVRTVVPPQATADLGDVRLLTMDEEDGALWRRQARWILDNTTTGITRDVPDFPLWIPLPDSVLDGAAPDVSDLRVRDESGVYRPIETVPGAGAGVWARMARIDGSSNEHHLDLLWGRSDAASWSDPRSVFDSAAGWRGVWHFDGSAACATQGCAALSGPSGADTGIAGGARRFDGAQVLVAPDSGTLEPSDLGVSVWVRIDAIAGTEARLVWKDSDGQSSLPSWGFIVRKESGKLQVGFRTRNGPSDSGLFAPVATGRWVHLAATVERTRGKAELFVDGASVGTFPVDSIAPAPRQGALRVGQGLVGRIDELRVARIPRAAAWFALERVNLLSTKALIHP